MPIEAFRIMNIEKISFNEKYFDINPKLEQSDRAALLNVLEKHWDRFAFTNQELGCTNLSEHSIDTGDSKTSIQQRLWTRYSEAENEFISQQIKEMLSCGVIERSYTPWACNVELFVITEPLTK